MPDFYFRKRTCSMIIFICARKNKWWIKISFLFLKMFRGRLDKQIQGKRKSYCESMQHILSLPQMPIETALYHFLFRDQFHVLFSVPKYLSVRTAATVSFKDRSCIEWEMFWYHSWLAVILYCLHIDNMQMTYIYFCHTPLEDTKAKPYSWGSSYVPRSLSQQFQLSPYPLPRYSPV